MDDEPKRPVAMCLTELNSCEDDAMDHGLRPVFEADDMQVAPCGNTTIILICYHYRARARCYAERGYVTVCCPSVRPSVLAFRYRDHVGWNTSKIISRLNSLRYLSQIDSNMGDLVQQERPPKYGGIARVGS